MSVLRIEGLSVTYGNVRALNDVSLRVEEGELVTLVGTNGAGKSTLMNAIVGLVGIESGVIEFNGQPLARRRTADMVRLGIAYVPEGRGTLRQLSVRENLLLGAFGRRNDASLQVDLQRAMERFPILGQRQHQLAGSLSGGEQQMLVIARGMMSRPRLMLLDEPSLGLAPKIGKQVFDTIAELRREGVTILLVEQNAHAALKLANRAYVLELGEIILEGADLISDERVRGAFLGESVTLSSAIQ